MRPPARLLAALLAAAPALLATARAQDAPLVLPCVLHDGERHTHDAAAVLAALAAGGAAPDARTNPPTTRTTVGAGLTITVDYDGFTPEAEAAFDAAVAVWADALASPVPVRVRATFAPLGPNVLGAAGPFIVRGFEAAPDPGTWYPCPLAEALAGEPLLSCAFDIEATFNSTQERFHVDPAAPPPADRFDFTSVVLHELGHGLGFVGSATVDDGTPPNDCTGVAGQGCLGFFGGTPTGSPLAFDRAIADAQGRALDNPLVYPSPSATMGAFLRSQTVRAGTPGVTAAAGGTAPRLWAPDPFQRGSSVFHWHEGDFPAGSPEAAMTPQIAPGEAFRSPGRLTCALFADLGWTLGPGCASLVPEEAAPAPAAVAFALDLAGPNPARQQTALRVRLAAPGALRAELFDALGRRVATLHDGPAADGLVLPVDLRGLAPGLYTVRALADGRAAAARLAVAR